MINKLKHISLLGLLVFSVVSAASGQVANALLSANVSTNFSNRLLSNGAGDATTQRIIELSNELYSPLVSQSVEVQYGRRLTKSLWLNTGIGLTNMGFKRKVKAEDLRWEDQIDPSRGFVEPIEDPALGWKWNKNKHKLRYVTLPVLLSYKKPSDKTYRLIVSGGPEYAYVSVAKVTQVQKYGLFSYDRSSRNWLNASRIVRHNLFVRAAFGFEFLMSQGTSLTAQVQARYGLRNTQDAPIHAHVYQTGFQLGINKVIH